MRNSALGRIRNWIYYYKWYVVLGVLLLFFALRYIAGIFGIADPHPDLQAAYVGRHILSEETVSQLEALLAEKAGDYNQDGKILVQLHQYLTSDETGAAEAQQNAAAAEVSLLGDIDSCESYFFLLEDPEQFQIEWQILADENGNPPGSSDYSVDKKVRPLKDLLPDLNSITAESDRNVLSSLWIGRRCFYMEKTCENAEELAGLWNALTGNGSAMSAAADGDHTGTSADGRDAGAVADSSNAGSPKNLQTGGKDTASGTDGVNDSSSVGSLQGTGNSLPSPDADGRIMIGNTVLAPYSCRELTLNEYNEALAANGFYYAVWTSGEPSSITNSEGEDALLYPLQLYMVTYEGTSAGDAGNKAAGWLAAAQANYSITNESSFSASGKEYTILEYRFTDTGSPYAQGVSAFLTSESKTAVCAELLSVESEKSAGSLRALLETFLGSL